MNRFKEQRLQAGYKTQADLAKILFVNQTAVSQWERGVTTPSSPILLKLSQIYGVTTDYLLGNDEPSHAGIKIPVLGDVAAGLPIEAVENIVDYEEIDQATAASGEYFALRIKGSSMEPKISSGDVVIVRKQNDADTGDIAIVLVNGDSATCKKIKKDPDGSLWLLPTNPAYEARHFSPAEIQSVPVAIIGKVVELRAKF